MIHEYNDIKNNKKKNSYKNRNRKTSFLGLSFPLTNSQYGYFYAETELIKQAKANLINLILTVKGERPFQPEFGTNIIDYIFDVYDSEYDEDIRQEIFDAVAIWLPYINIEAVNISPSNTEPHVLNIEIVFSLIDENDVKETVTLKI